MRKESLPLHFLTTTPHPIRSRLASNKLPIVTGSLFLEYILLVCAIMPYIYTLCPPEWPTQPVIPLATVPQLATNDCKHVEKHVWASMVEHGKYFTCICMHHLNVTTPCRACIVYGIQMTNYIIKGQSDEVATFNVLGQERTLPVAVIVGWEDMGRNFTGRIDGVHAACLLLNHMVRP